MSFSVGKLQLFGMALLTLTVTLNVLADGPVYTDNKDTKPYTGGNNVAASVSYTDPKPYSGGSNVAASVTYTDPKQPYSGGSNVVAASVSYTDAKQPSSGSNVSAYADKAPKPYSDSSSKNVAAYGPSYTDKDPKPNSGSNVSTAYGPSYTDKDPKPYSGDTSSNVAAYAPTYTDKDPKPYSGGSSSNVAQAYGPTYNDKDPQYSSGGSAPAYGASYPGNDQQAYRSDGQYAPDVCVFLPANAPSSPIKMFGRSIDIPELSFERSISEAENVTSHEDDWTNFVSNGSASALHTMNQYPKEGVAELDKVAQIGAEAAKNLLARGFDYSPDYNPGYIKKTSLANCYAKTYCNWNSPYRTMDGSCNNMQQPHWGQALTPLRRVLTNAYGDGFSSPRGTSPGGTSYLPSPRFVSTQIFGKAEIYDPKWTALFMVFGQFAAHDATHVPVYVDRGYPDGRGLDCCNRDGRLNYNDPSLLNVCFPIALPPNDALGSNCMNFVRSQRAPRLDCQPGPLDQVNQVTHWIDSSMLYGSSNNEASKLRSYKWGMLKTGRTSAGTELMPVLGNGRFLAGDERVNQHPYLGLINSIFLREHNRWARELHRINPHWSDEVLFQESRKIINAEWQHIIYNEYLPGLLGQSYSDSCGLTPKKTGYSYEYYTDFDPTVANEFSTAAFRVCHTMIPSVVKFLSAYGSPRALVLMRDLFNNNEALKNPGGVDSLLFGMTLSPMANVDENFSEEILNWLFGKMDLIATDIQRGRDHGLQGYIEYRKICKIGKPVYSFEDLQDVMTPNKIELLRRSYSKVEEIDAFVGMTMESPAKDALVGPTIRCLIADQFARLKFGDRFFYDLGGQDWSFTQDQLNEIRKITMSRLICDNGDYIQRIQRDSFLLPNPQFNPMYACNGDAIPSVNIYAWADVPPQQPLPPQQPQGYPIQG